jgi:DNA-binding response OmpR family regulator
VTSILIIDDDETMRKMLRVYFEMSGYLVEEAGNGALGLSAFDAFKPNLVFVDLFMPAKDGLETIIEMRNRSATVAIVAMSAGGVFAQGNMLSVASELGADVTFEKPLSMKKVMPIVHGLLARSVAGAIAREC